jgi:hypothetical protein
MVRQAAGLAVAVVDAAVDLEQGRHGTSPGVDGAGWLPDDHLTIDLLDEKVQYFVHIYRLDE